MRRAIPFSVILLATLAVFLGWQPKAGPPAQTIAPGVMLDHLEVGRLAAPTAAELISWLVPLWDHPPLNATIDHTTGAVRPGQPGWRLDVSKTLAVLLSAGPGQEVPPVLQTVEPRWPAEALQNLSTPLASFQTTITGDANRVYNVELATSLLNNTLVLPSQVFSFNAVAGPYETSRGYREAPVIVDNRYEMGAGGGVCQLSSTLYQAVQALGLTVVERHGHTLPVTYIKTGQDATVAGSLDFRFRNDLITPLVIKASRQGDILAVVLLGRKDEAKSVPSLASPAPATP
ncbi:MAG TPA: VanW family protein [Spirochaetia bacterium]|nr:VanW family protein [Spirochaetia bacterium]